MSTKARFEELWGRVVGPQKDGEAWARLDAGYREPHRAYHAWPHIAAMLAGLDEVREEPAFAAARFDEIETAIFFHDAVYDARRDDNEALSAELFQTCAGERAAMGPEGVRRVAAMILATAKHLPAPDISTRLLLDLDLAVLGSAPEKYASYAGAVRKEFAFVPDAAWRTGRAAVMDRFLARERLYQTDCFHARHERQARVNIAGEIDRLCG